MLILITTLLLFAAALTLVILRLTRPEFRFTWLIATSITFLAFITVILWQVQIPLSFTLPAWEPASLFSTSPSFSADRLSWPYALSLVTVVLAILLTASVREDFSSSLSWAGSITLCGLGLLAVTASNPLTLVMVWAALDLAELVAMLRSVKGREASERVVIAFSTRAGGIVLLLLADAVSSTAGKAMDFLSTPPQAGLLLLAAAGLRLGVLPLHLPYSSESSLRRGVGTALRLVTAASSLVLLARIPTSSLASPFTPLLLILACIAALYGGWMWMRASDELTGRPYWLIGLGGLAVASALRGNPTGATAWGVALVLAGGALFLASVQQTWINRAVLIGAWALSSLPFSLTASGWLNNVSGFDLFLPFLLIAQALIIVGLIRNTLRPSARATLESQPVWARSVYPSGIGILLIVQLLLGFWGWDGAMQIGAWIAGIAASLLTLGLLWATPRFPALNPVRAHWVQPATNSRLDQLYQSLWDFYLRLGRFSQTITNTLEGEGGIMWVLLFLVLFVSLIIQRKP
ncbi:MAG TPA: hypothetical protein VHM28_08620 [Anaerolineales bacterium]|jgi:hypothetical protein|nr:hypothetical protein [Anaerolineales bacterium]